VLCTITSAQTKSYALNFKPYLGLNSGKTDYVIDIKIPYEGYIYFLKSQLEFPLDQTMIGGSAELKLQSGTKREWVLNLGFYTNVNDPNGKMYDHDWWNIRTGMTEKFSYTESKSEGNNNIFLVEIDKLIIISKKVNISISGGFKYQKIEQEIYGFSGWQFDLDSIHFDIDSPDIHGLSYEVAYKLPNAGFKINYFLNQKLTFYSRIAYTRAIISDFDDHLLRFKTTESSINGNGLLADFGLHMDFGPTPGKGFFVEFNGDFTYIKASGTSTQSWYGDDPAGEEDETGQSVSGIPHEISTTQFRLGLVLGLGF
ncbi:MAG: omptin family outer membrane protease, partial [bacterium]